jgi:predicted transcriptional regulator
MPQSLIELAKELTVALIQTGNLLPQDVQETLQKTHTTLTALKALEASGFPAPGAPSQSPPGDWRKSITKYSITCLECGHAFKQLSIRHLRQHGLDARSYRTKYEIPRSKPLAARETTARRRQVVQETRPWEKAPTYCKGQAQADGNAAPEPDADALPEETEASIVAAAPPAPTKRQRKTASPKQAARKKRAAG